MNKILAQNLKKARKDKGLSQGELGALIGNGVSYQVVQQYESGRVKPRPERLQEIADALEVSPEWFLQDHEEPKIPAGESSSDDITFLARLVMRAQKELERIPGWSDEDHRKATHVCLRLLRSLDGFYRGIMNIPQVAPVSYTNLPAPPLNPLINGLPLPDYLQGTWSR